MRKTLETRLGFLRDIAELLTPSLPFLVFLRQDKYMDYMMREFQGLEAMRKSQYRLLFQLPMKIIPL